MIALVSAKGSPGVTVSALAFTLTWPGRCLLAECDPAGGDVLAGYLRGSLDARRGLAELAVAELRGRLRDEFERQLVDLEAPRRRRLLLPGVRDPAQAATVAPVWPAETTASTRPAASSAMHTAIEVRGSAPAIAASHIATARAAYRSSMRSLMASSTRRITSSAAGWSPTSTRCRSGSVPQERRAPSTTTAGAWSPPRRSTAIRT